MAKLVELITPTWIPETEGEYIPVFDERIDGKRIELVRCKDCKHRPKEPNWKTYEDGFDIEFPEGSKCPCLCHGDGYYSWYPKDDWFCADGERRTE